jgi:hypothetical protein
VKENMELEDELSILLKEEKRELEVEDRRLDVA